ncbi:MAG: alpha/beta hydrolase family protein [Clostridiaceae bacterium]
MSFFDGVIYSEALQIDTRLGIILPQDSRNARLDAPCYDAKHTLAGKTLLLLHGLTDNAAAWWMRTSIIRYAERYGIAVVMPQAEKSFYRDMVYGDAFFTYVTEELPELCSGMFQMSFAPDDLMIAGLSMGGYGALKCALTYPERYIACGAFSSVADIRQMAVDVAAHPPTRGFDATFKAIFGDPASIPDDCDLFRLAERNCKSLERLRVYMTCGRQDGLYEANTRLAARLNASMSSRVLFEEWNGTHEWGFWDESIKRMLSWVE